MKKLVLVAACLMLLSNTYAQKSNSLLWEISGNGLKTSSYLFGTYHLVGKTLVDSLPEITNRFNTCKAVVGELLLDSTVIMKLVPYMISPDSLTLDKIFTPDEHQQIAACIKDVLHMDGNALDRLKPAAVDNMITTGSVPTTVGPKNPPIDMYFQQEGIRRNEKVIGLETLQQQAEMLLNSPIDEQKKQLLKTVSKKDKLRANALKMYEMYRHQDLAALGKLIDNSDEQTPEQIEKLLKNRNLNWMTQLPAIMQEQPTFIAVGAGHLIGQYGLIKQLQLKGYTVKPVKI